MIVAFAPLLAVTAALAPGLEKLKALSAKLQIELRLDSGLALAVR